MLNNKKIVRSSLLFFIPLLLCAVTMITYQLTRTPLLILPLIFWPVIFLVIFPAKNLIAEFRQKRKAERFVLEQLGPNYDSVAPNVKRSADGKRLLRGQSYIWNSDYSLWGLQFLSDSELTEKNVEKMVKTTYFEGRKKAAKESQLLVALIKKGHGEQIVPHLLQLRPGEEPSLCDFPDFLVIESDGEAAILSRQTRECLNVGETWHQTLREAKEQAEYEYRNLLTEWESPPCRDCRDIVEWLRDWPDF